MLVLGVPLGGMCQSYDVDLVQSVRDAPVHSHPAANAETAFTAGKGTIMEKDARVCNLPFTGRRHHQSRRQGRSSG